MATACTLNNLKLYGPVMEAVFAAQRVRFVGKGGRVLSGTLRGFVPEENYATHASHRADVGQLWVRITLTSGFDTWLSAPELAEMHQEGNASFG